MLQFYFSSILILQITYIFCIMFINDPAPFGEYLSGALLHSECLHQQHLCFTVPALHRCYRDTTALLQTSRQPYSRMFSKRNIRNMLLCNANWNALFYSTSAWAVHFYALSFASFAYQDVKIKMSPVHLHAMKIHPYFKCMILWCTIKPCMFNFLILWARTV